MDRASGRVAAVIVTHNPGEAVSQTLAAVLAQEPPPEPVLVVDNASADGTPERLSRLFGPRLDLRRNDCNLGSAGGFRDGVRLALAAGADAVWLLDQDARPRPGALAALRDALQADPRAGAAGSRILVRGAGELIQECGLRVSRRTGRLHHVGRGRTELAADWPFAVDALAYTSLLVRRRAVESAGEIDPLFFLYYDDLEWTWRIRRSGFALLAVPASRVEHDDSALKPLTAERRYLVMRNRYRFFGLAMGWAARRWLLALQAALMDSWAGWNRRLGRAPEAAALAAALADSRAGRGGPPALPGPSSPPADAWDGVGLGPPATLGGENVHLEAGDRLDLAVPALAALAAQGVGRERITVSAAGFAASFLRHQGWRLAVPPRPFAGVVLDRPSAALTAADRQLVFRGGQFFPLSDYAALLDRHRQADAARRRRRLAAFLRSLALGI